MFLPSEYVAAAVRRISSRIARDCEIRLTHNGHTSSVTRVASTMKGEDGVSGSTPVEAIRVLALASSFPAIAKGEAVTLDDTFRLVTSARFDISGASVYIGLTLAFDKRSATYSGDRRDGDNLREVLQPAGILTLEGELDSAIDGSVAPIHERMWTVVIRKRDWLDVTAPEVGDRIDFMDGWRKVSLVVAAVSPQNGYFALTARTR